MSDYAKERIKNDRIRVEIALASGILEDSWRRQTLGRCLVRLNELNYEGLHENLQSLTKI